MDDDVAGRQRGGLGDEVGGTALPARAAHQAVAEDVLLGHDDEVVGLEAGLQLQNGEPGLARRQLLHLGKCRHALEIAQMMLGQDLRQTVERALRPSRHHDPAFRRALVGNVLHHFAEDVDLGVGALLGKAPAGARAGMEHPRLPRLGRGEGRQFDRLALRGRRVHVLGRQIHQVRRNGLVGHRLLQRTAGLALARLVVVEDQRVALGQCLVRQMVEHHRHVRQIVEDRVQPLVEEGQPVLHAGEAPAFADGRIERVVARGRAERLDIGAAEAADGFRRQRHLAHGLQCQRVALAGGALAGHVEGADRFQRVAEEVEAQRLVGAGRVEVEDAAAHGELAHLAHRGHALEAGILQPRDQPVHVDLIARPATEGLRLDQFRRRNALEQRVGGGEHDGAVRLAGQRRHAGQRIEPPRGGIRTRRDAVIGQAVPCRQVQHRQAGIGEGQGLDDGGQALAVARHEQHRPVGRDLARNLGQREGFEAVGNAVEDKGTDAAPCGALGQADGRYEAHAVTFRLRMSVRKPVFVAGADNPDAAAPAFRR